MTDTWEERMSVRAKARQAAEVHLTAQVEEGQLIQQPWLNGWRRTALRNVLIGTGVHCICCGRCLGVICVAFSKDWKPPENDPDWPFDNADCPLCTRPAG